MYVPGYVFKKTALFRIAKNLETTQMTISGKISKLRYSHTVAFQGSCRNHSRMHGVQMKLGILLSENSGLYKTSYHMVILYKSPNSQH